MLSPFAQSVGAAAKAASPQGGFDEVAAVPSERTARPDAASSVASIAPAIDAPCVLASERPARPDDEGYSAKPSLVTLLDLPRERLEDLPGDVRVRLHERPELPGRQSVALELGRRGHRCRPRALGDQGDLAE